jgi:hypothetical protein
MGKFEYSKMPLIDENYIHDKFNRKLNQSYSFSCSLFYVSFSVTKAIEHQMISE